MSMADRMTAHCASMRMVADLTRDMTSCANDVLDVLRKG